jgi:hypothetical protein
MLALTYRQEFFSGWSADNEETLESAMQLAERAISFNDAIPEAYFV